MNTCGVLDFCWLGRWYVTGEALELETWILLLEHHSFIHIFICSRNVHQVPTMCQGTDTLALDTRAYILSRNR